MKKLLALALALTFCAGCSHNIRFTLARLDARRASQIKAMQVEQCIVYESARGASVTESDDSDKAIDPSLYATVINNIAEMLPKLPWDVSVFTLEISPCLPATK